MAGALRKTMVYLGLAEDELGYDDYDDYDEPEGATGAPERRAAVTPMPQRAHLPGSADRPRRASCRGSRPSIRAPTTRPRRSASTSATACR